MELFAKQFVYLEWDDILKGKKAVIGDTLGELKKKLQCELFDSVMENKGDYPFTKSEDDMNFAMAYYDPNYACKRAYYCEDKPIQIRHTPESEWVDLKREEPKWHSCYEYRVKPEKTAEIILPTNVNAAFKVVVNEAEEFPKVNIVPSVSIMPLDWCIHAKGQFVDCIKYAIKNYCNRCVHKDSSCIPQPARCQGFMEPKHVKKRCMTNRELAKWVAQGNGECMGDEIAMSCWRYVYNEADMPVKDDVQIRGWDETEWHEPIVEED